MKKVIGEVRAADIVNELLNVHPEYAEGEAKGFSVEGGPDKRPVVEWLHEVYSLYEEIKANEMDDRNVIFGLILLDNNLKDELIETNFLNSLLWEIEEKQGPINSLLTPMGLKLAEEVVKHQPPIQTSTQEIPSFKRPQTKTQKRPQTEIKTPTKPETLYSHSDRDSKIDQLNRKPFAHVLAKHLRQIWDENQMENGGAFLMNIYGPWGSGKTTILNFLEESLEDLECVFDWNEIPGKDEDRLKEFLISFNLPWVEDSKIEKYCDDEIIKVSNGHEYLLLKLSNEHVKMVLRNNNLKNDHESFEFIVKEERGS